jgi:hypothetical protein
VFPARATRHARRSNGCTALRMKISNPELRGSPKSKVVILANRGGSHAYGNRIIQPRNGGIVN